MNLGRLLARNLAYHWRGNAAVLLGVGVGTAVLTGALLVGDSLRGSLRENSERATAIIGDYVKALIRDDKIGPLFQDIRLADLDRGATGDLLRFEITFRPKAPKS